MTQLTFFPLGNADTTLVEFRDGRRMLVDYAARGTGKVGDKRCDLPALLNADLRKSGQSDYAVVVFTHLDDDHCQGAEEFFHLDVAAKYQGGDRHKIGTMWVPAGAITEEGLGGSARVIRQEARHRLIAGKGIKVFSRPERLTEWLSSQGLTVQSRKSCFVDAGKLVEDFTLPWMGWSSSPTLHMPGAPTTAAARTGMVIPSCSRHGFWKAGLKPISFSQATSPKRCWPR